jgi:F420-dependent oxidoreductase-like protein
MDVGLHIADYAWPDYPESIPGNLVDAGHAAEEAGFRWLSVMDHFFQMDRYADVMDPMLEAYTTLGFLAAATSRIRLQVLVTGVTYRHPGILAKTVTTLDVLSGGRAGLGIGAAWYEREHRGLGVPFPPVPERMERLEETLKICLEMFCGQGGPYRGRHYQLAEPINSPLPLSRPRPPIMIGGSGERRTLRLVAKYADACNLYASGPEVVEHKLEVLRDHCGAAGRDYRDIEKTVIYSGDPLADAAAFLHKMQRYAELGITGVFVMPGKHAPGAFAEEFGRQVMPELAEF